MTTATDPTIGVLALHNSKESKAILNAVEALGYESAWLREETTAIGIEDGAATLEPDVDVVINRLLLSTDEYPIEAIGLADAIARLRPMLNRPTAVTTAIHKYATATALAAADVPVPDAFLGLSGERLNAERDRFGEHAVYKTAIGTHGGGAWVVDLDDPVNPTVGNRRAFLQQFIEPPEGPNRDVRVYVVDGDVIGAMHRTAAEGEWRSNVALGGEVEDATETLPQDVRDIAVRATAEIGLDFAGVDLVEGPEGWLVLEVNPTAGFRGLFKATETSPAPYIAGMAIERAGGTVETEKLDRLAGTLDDSRPTSAPPKRTRSSGEPATVGYIESVTVTGTRGTETVLAKSDTGADRTSVDTQLATELGTGPIRDVVRVKSGSSKTAQARPVVDIVVGIGGTQHTVTASIEDRSHMSYPLLLGRDILSHYRVDVSKRVDESTTEGPETEE